MKMEQTRCNSSRGVRKRGKWQQCSLVFYVLLTECLEQVRRRWVCHWCSSHVLILSSVINNTATATWNLFVLLMKKQNLSMVTSLMDLSSTRSLKYMKEPIKMHVEFSLLYKTSLIIEMRSKIFKANYRRSSWVISKQFWTLLTSFPWPRF